MKLVVKHALGDDEFPGDYLFTVDAGGLVIFTPDRAGVKAYGRDVWATVGYESKDAAS